MNPPLATRPDGTTVCSWGEGSELYAAYHDTEWGVPVTSDAGLFERMSLEGFQSGLSWLTVLRKRPAFRAAFAGFEPEAVAAFTGADVDRLVADAGIIRHRGKIEAVVNNARQVPALRSNYGGLAAFFWSFAPERRPDEPGALSAIVEPQTADGFTVPATTPASHAMSKALKSAGWRFVGPTTCYALMQAVGVVNDHLPGCFRRPEVAALRAEVPLLRG